jgi:uncharacterized protein (DUF2164 family)
MKPRIQLSREQRDLLINKLKEFFLNERDQEIGDLAASLILDFIIENIAPAFYNQGIQDCIAFMKDKMEDLYGLEI